LESKNGFGSNQISNDDFYANYTDLWLKILAYNIYILFRTEICHAKHKIFTITKFSRVFYDSCQISDPRKTVAIKTKQYL